MSNTQFFRQMLSGEFDKFHNVLAAVPGDKLSYQPEPKARTAEALVGHLIGHVQDLSELLDDGVINHRNQVPFDSIDAGVELFDKSFRELEAKLENVSAEAWQKAADFKVGEQVIMTAPAQMMMWMLLFDSIHHRGQLSTYLRPMGSKVPAIYGPSADTDH